MWYSSIHCYYRYFTLYCLFDTCKPHCTFWYKTETAWNSFRLVSASLAYLFAYWKHANEADTSLRLFQCFFSMCDGLKEQSCRGDVYRCGKWWVCLVQRGLRWLTMSRTTLQRTVISGWHQNSAVHCALRRRSYVPHGTRHVATAVVRWHLTSPDAALWKRIRVHCRWHLTTLTAWTWVMWNSRSSTRMTLPLIWWTQASHLPRCLRYVWLMQFSRLCNASVLYCVKGFHLYSVLAELCNYWKHHKLLLCCGKSVTLFIPLKKKGCTSFKVFGWIAVVNGFPCL